jgi:ribose transport system permease protein
MARSIEQNIDTSTRGHLSSIVSRQTLWVFFAAAAAFLTLSLATDGFLTQQNLFNITRNSAFVAIIALGMTAVISSGGIDLSVGSVMYLAAVVVGITMSSEFSIWVGIGAALLAAAAVGSINGLLIAYVGMPPFVITLGMLAIVRGLAMVLSNNRAIFEFGPNEAALLVLGGSSTFGVANPAVALVVLTLITGFLFRYAQWGCHLFAIGGDERAATLAGVHVQRIKVGVYLLCALMAGISGVLEVGWVGSVTPDLGQNMEIAVIAAAVIGGAHLSGGSGTALGAVIGAALIEISRNSLALLRIDSLWQDIFIGGFIVLAAMFDRLKAAIINK